MPGPADATHFLHAPAARGPQLRCALCHATISAAEATQCPACGTLLHQDCRLDAEPSVRVAAAEALAAGPTPGAWEPLVRALDDGDPTVRAAAADGLGSFGGRFGSG